MPMSVAAPITILNQESFGIRRSTHDSELVTACLAGDAAAERALYDAHVEALYRTAFRMCGDSDVAEDITQEAFVRAYRRLGQFRGEASLRTWLTSIVISSASTILRKGSWLHNRSTQLTENIAEAKQRGDPELAALLDSAVAKLSPKLQVVFVMYDVEGYTHPEISSALGIPVGTSKARLHTARAKLRAALERDYGAWRS